MTTEPQGTHHHTDQADKSSSWVEALYQGMAVLRVFDGEHSGLTLTEIAHKLGWSRTKPYRYVYTLEQMGYLVRQEGTKRYRPTSLTMTLGYSYLSGLSLLELAQPILDRLKNALGASVHMGILEQGEVVYIASARVSVVPAVNIHVGSRVPPYVTSLGRALLSEMGDDQIDALIGKADLPASTPRSITKPAAFRQMLKTSREQGYVFTDEEFHPGVRSIAAPVHDRKGEVVAAINATSIVQKFSDAYLAEQVVPLVVGAAEEISMSMGFMPRLKP
jgi:IclR family pca regulon transcriptional regulator